MGPAFYYDPHPMLNATFRPHVSPAIWERFPSYRALSVTVKDYQPQTKPPPLTIACAPWCDAHVEAWREAYRAFGAQPKKTPSSLESLLKRYRRDNALPVIDDLVDAYNALCLNWGAPFGGEDAAAYAGSPQLVIADGSETFDTSRDGQIVVEHPEPGEVIWRDGTGVTCRRWNWRQCKRTALHPGSRDLWFVIDRLEPMPVDDLRRAGDALRDALSTASPQALIAIDLLAP
jgi:DNA/RNA-binding domain of Phe-tRNA-synthetase-like protein